MMKKNLSAAIVFSSTSLSSLHHHHTAIPSWRRGEEDDDDEEQHQEQEEVEVGRQPQQQQQDEEEAADAEEQPQEGQQQQEQQESLSSSFLLWLSWEQVAFAMITLVAIGAVACCYIRAYAEGNHGGGGGVTPAAGREDDHSNGEEYDFGFVVGVVDDDGSSSKEEDADEDEDHEKNDPALLFLEDDNDDKKAAADPDWSISHVMFLPDNQPLAHFVLFPAFVCLVLLYMKRFAHDEDKRNVLWGGLWALFGAPMLFLFYRTGSDCNSSNHPAIGNLHWVGVASWIVAAWNWKADCTRIQTVTVIMGFAIGGTGEVGAFLWNPQSTVFGVMSGVGEAFILLTWTSMIFNDNNNEKNNTSNHNNFHHHHHHHRLDGCCEDHEDGGKQ